jgi:flagellar biosynthesis anti-sigma factor FlgM
MKVSGGVSHSLKQAQAQQAEAKNVKNATTDKAQSAQGSDPSASAQVSLSQRAKQIQQATEIAKDNSVDEAKVARLQNLIDSGKYQVDAAQVADRLVDSHMKMPS